MTLKQITCHVLTCDTCGEPEDVDGMTPHYESADHAHAYSTEDPGVGDPEVEVRVWTWHADGTHACPRCTAKARCAERGHAWRALARHMRWCERCCVAHPENGDGVVGSPAECVLGLGGGPCDDCRAIPQTEAATQAMKETVET
jgi:hypothetical protein